MNMSSQRPFFVLGLAFIVLAPTIAAAQGPWSVTVTPSMATLPMGFCTPVRITVFDPAIKDTPRNSKGTRVTIADFDLDVTTPNGTWAVGRPNGDHWWNACACQGAAVGTVGTVTATYPARNLAAASRIAGVAFQSVGTFTIAAPKGTDNPPGCLTSAGPTIAVAPRSGASPPTTLAAPGAIAGQPVPAPVTAAPGPIGGVPITGTGVARAPGGAIAPGAVIPPAPVSAIPPAPAPAFVLANPSGFTAVQTAPGQVQFSWQPVVGASFYGLFGPGVSVGGEKVVGATTFTATAVPAGSQQWSVGSYFDPGPVTTAFTEFPKVTLNVIAPAPPVVAAAGRYRVTLTGLRTWQASYDDQLSRDGMGDEVYTAVYLRHYDRRSGTVAIETNPRTLTYGDTKFFNTRKQAGKWSATGGIRSSDPIPDNTDPSQLLLSPSDDAFPLRVWEGTLTDGVDVLVISPSLWEEDGKEQVYLYWRQEMGAITSSIFANPSVQNQIASRRFGPLVVGTTVLENGTPPTAAPPAPAATSAPPATPPAATGTTAPPQNVFQKVGTSVGATAGKVGKGVENAAKNVATGVGNIAKGVSSAVQQVKGIVQGGMDRPIGIQISAAKDFVLPHATVVLTREIIEAGLAPLPPGTGLIGPPVGWPRMPRPGVMMITFLDGQQNVGLIPVAPARYELYLTVERLP